MRRRGDLRWTPLLSPAAALRAPLPTSDPWLHLVIVCGVETELSCEATGVVAPEGLPAVAGEAAYVAISGNQETTLLRIAADGAGLISADGIVPGESLHIGEWGGAARALLFRHARYQEPAAPILIQAPLDRFVASVHALPADAYVQLPALERPNISEGIRVRISRDAVAYSISRRSGIGEFLVHRAGVVRRLGEGVLDEIAAFPEATLIAWTVGSEMQTTLLDRELLPSDTSIPPMESGNQLAYETTNPHVWITATSTTAHVHRLEAGTFRTIGQVASSCGRSTGCLRGVVALEERTFLIFWNEMVELRIDGDEVTQVRSAVVMPLS